LFRGTWWNYKLFGPRLDDKWDGAWTPIRECDVHGDCRHGLSREHKRAVISSLKAHTVDHPDVARVVGFENSTSPHGCRDSRDEKPSRHRMKGDDGSKSHIPRYASSRVVSSSRCPAQPKVPKEYRRVCERHSAVGKVERPPRRPEAYGDKPSGGRHRQIEKQRIPDEHESG
jgi:hypothetical protein